MFKIISSALLVCVALVGCTSGSSPEPAAPPATPQVVERASDISSSDCTDIKGNVSAVEFTFREGTASPAQIILILNTTGADFQQISSSYEGSERDWLLKMAELSESLAEFVNSGAGDGGLLFDQLSNNYGLVEQFCG